MEKTVLEAWLASSFQERVDEVGFRPEGNVVQVEASLVDLANILLKGES